MTVGMPPPINCVTKYNTMNFVCILGQPVQQGMMQVGPVGYPRGMPPRVMGPQGMRMPPQYGPGAAAYGPRGPMPQGATQRLTHMAASVNGPGVSPRVIGPMQPRFPVSVGKTRPTLLQDQPLLLEDLVEKVRKS